MITDEDRIDENAPPAGMEAIPVDMPDKPEDPDTGGLPYTLQAFNELVAANTAMTSELSNNAIIIGDLRENVRLLRDDAKSQEKIFERLMEQANEHRAERKNWEKETSEVQITLGFQRDTISALKQKLERSKGYIDRVLEQEAGYEEKPSLPAPPRMQPAKGPALNDVSLPVRTSSHSTATAWEAMPSRSHYEAPGSYDMPRRY